jgi:tetratricopeptide (TPR) repeat protein
MFNKVIAKSGLCIALILCGSILLAGNAKFHIDVGLNHFYKKRYLEAYREFKTALERNPKSPEAHYNLGRVYKAQGFVKEALIEFQIAVKLNPRYLAAQRELQIMKRDLEADVRAQLKIEGRENFQRHQQVEISGKEAEKRGRDLLRQGRSREAISAFEQALREDKTNPTLNKLLGYLYFRQGSYSNSLKRYTAAFSITPTDAEIPYAVGLIYMKTKQPQKATEQFKNALKLDSGMVKAVFALGESYEAQEKIEEAIFQFRKCLELNPALKEAEGKLSYLAGRVSYTYFSRGSYFYKQGNYEKAESLLSLARTYGNLSADQNRQIDEMLNASRYWINKRQAQNKITSQRKKVRQNSYINKNISVYDVARNPLQYVGQSVDWTGNLEFTTTENGKRKLFLNSNSEVDPETDMDHSFEVIFPKNLPQDPRIGENAQVEVKGKILKVKKIFNKRVSAFSKRRQPIVEATEVMFIRKNYDQPLVIRFY